MREAAGHSLKVAGEGPPAAAMPAADRERILLLECRLEQLRSAVDEARADADRARGRLAEASAREADHARHYGLVHQELAEARAEIASLHERLGRSEALRAELEGHLFEANAGDDAAELVRLRREVLAHRQRSLINERTCSRLRARVDELLLSRETLLTRIAEWQRLVRSDGPEAVDLAEFIAELRGDILHLEHRNAAGERQEAMLRERLIRAGLDPDAPPGEDTVGTSVDVAADPESAGSQTGRTTAPLQVRRPVAKEPADTAPSAAAGVSDDVGLVDPVRRAGTGKGEAPDLIDGTLPGGSTTSTRAGTPEVQEVGGDTPVITAPGDVADRGLEVASPPAVGEEAPPGLVDDGVAIGDGEDTARGWAPAAAAARAGTAGDAPSDDFGAAQPPAVEERTAPDWSDAAIRTGADERMTTETRDLAGHATPGQDSAPEVVDGGVHQAGSDDISAERHDGAGPVTPGQDSAPDVADAGFHQASGGDIAAASRDVATAAVPGGGKPARLVGPAAASGVGEADARHIVATATTVAPRDAAASAAPQRVGAIPAMDGSTAATTLRGQPTGATAGPPVAGLRAPDPAVRASAYERLVRLLERDPAQLAEHLRSGLADPHARVRRRAVLAAATARHLALHPLLDPLRGDPDPQVRRVVREVLRHGSPTQPLAGDRETIPAPAQVPLENLSETVS